MNKRKIVLLTILIVLILIAAFAGYFYYQNLRGAWTALKKPPQDIAEVIKYDNTPFTLPPGFKVFVFAKNLSGARVMIFDEQENIWLSQTGQGKVIKFTLQNQQLKSQETIFSNLKNPHGLAFDPDNKNILFIAEETKISRVDLAVPDKKLEKIIDLPERGNHYTRTIKFGHDGRLYVSIGSTCNVCYEKDPRYAAIYSLNKDGSDFKQLAKGLRNSVFFVWSPFEKDEMWTTEMGRDLLGDNLPPEEINVINISSTTTLNYGWPICYGKNIHDDNFDKNKYIMNPCQEPYQKGSHIDLPAHNAPLGLAFTPEKTTWPETYKNNLFVALHGSWNRSVPDGYKVIRIVLDKEGKEIKQEDFFTGFLTSKGALGRPVDIIFDKSGNMYVSDDKSGVVYKIVYEASYILTNNKKYAIISC